MKSRRSFVILFFVFLAVGLAADRGHSSLSSTNYRISNSVISGGGGVSVSSSYTISSTVGQAAAGTMLSSGYQIFLGFWYVEKIPPLSGIYLLLLD